MRSRRSRRPHRARLRLAWALAMVAPLLLFASASVAQTPAPPSNVVAVDHDWDNGKKVDLSWDLSPDDASIDGYQIMKSETDADGVTTFAFLDIVMPGTSTYTANELQHGESYHFQVFAFRGTSKSEPVQTATAVTTTMEAFDGERLWLAIITLVFCGAVIYWILHARSGKPVKVRKIAGLEAVDEAVGRATEMGRSCLYIPGIQDINEIQTIASMTVLARVAKTAAEYDAKVEVPTSRSLVMTTARETVQAAFLAAGRPDAYNKDLIYYVTDEQFGFVAYLQGMMVREKPAACFYMGAFFAESLILAETGNSIGAIQIAGTAMPAQLPFFVAACDYTLIGEEFFAASAYLSGSPEELGSLKGQDVGKVIVAILLVIGVLAATIGAMADAPALDDFVAFLKNTMLT
ncbi:MAG: fibronectin type III domain-containing protein [Phycisphaerales bacterium]|nr:fibronectin type III domain-containing protein [Phycisphaerales bacterium]